jgi:predicted phosphoadenosine phosphosulfate sulfurtransferase
MWKNRCYSDGIPDEVPVLLERSGRAPSYKAIAKCLLGNDMNMRGLGFVEEASPVYMILKRTEISQRKN